MKSKTLEEAAQALFAAVQSQQAGVGAAGGNASADSAAEEVVDAAFTEVKDDDKQ